MNDLGAVAPVGRIIPNPPFLIFTASKRRVKDNAPYLRCRAKQSHSPCGKSS
jgi:hypothetical protein